MRRFLALFFSLLMIAGIAQAEFVFANPSANEESNSGEATVTFTSKDDDGSTQLTLTPSASSADAVEILITAAGDVTLGGNMRKNPSSNMYTKIIDKLEGDYSYFFANVYDVFSQDDMTLINFEGTFTEATKHKDNDFCFRAPKEHVEILTSSSIEAVAFENNHVMDFYEQGYNDTIEVFEQNNIVYATEAHVGVFEVKGVSIAMLAYQTFNDQYPRLLEQMPLDIATLRAAHDIIIVSYHWGDEGKFAPNSKQVKLGRATIDAGADLVLGHHSHRINPIEEYDGKYIVYSLANCSFSGNTKPDNMDSFLYQQKFTVEDGVTTPGAFRIIPCSISSNSAANDSKSEMNDLVITPFTPGGKGAQRVVEIMLKYGEDLEYAVKEYPTEW